MPSGKVLVSLLLHEMTCDAAPGPQQALRCPCLTASSASRCCTYQRIQTVLKLGRAAACTALEPGKVDTEHSLSDLFTNEILIRPRAIHTTL